MALKEVYVDPSIAADSGTGTIGDPYGDVEYAVRQTTFDTVNGTRVNIKAGTDEVLAAKLETALADTVTTVAWAPSESALLVFQGYTSVAGDGGIGGISGGGLVNIFNDATLDHVALIDLHLHSGPADAAYLVDLDNSITVTRCEIGPTDNGGLAVDSYSHVSQCYVHDIGANYGIGTNGDCVVEHNYIDLSGDTGAAGGISLVNGAMAHFNIVLTVGNDYGISSGGEDVSIEMNSIYSTDAGTGGGIYVAGSSEQTMLRGNLIEGYSGVGGSAICYQTSTGGIRQLVANAYYDCTAGSDSNGYNWSEFFQNDPLELLTASPFTDAANGDFSPVLTVGNIKEGALPNVIGGGFV